MRPTIPGVRRSERRRPSGVPGAGAASGAALAPGAMKIFFDGGCRPNPGTMEAGVVAGGRFHHRPDLGHGTSEEAEWLALLEALAVARALRLGEILLLGDAAGVLAQADGRVRLRNPAFAPWLDRYRQEAALFRLVRLRHIRRTQNLAGIALEQVRARGRQASR